MRVVKINMVHITLHMHTTSILLILVATLSVSLLPIWALEQLGSEITGHLVTNASNFYYVIIVVIHRNNIELGIICLARSVRTPVFQNTSYCIFI